MSLAERLFRTILAWWHGPTPRLEPLIYTRYTRAKVPMYYHEKLLSDCTPVYPGNSYVTVCGGVPTVKSPKHMTTVGQWRAELGAEAIRVRDDFRAVSLN